MSDLSLPFYSETSVFLHFKKTYFDTIFQIEKYSFETWLGIFKFSAVSPPSRFLMKTQLAGNGLG